MNQVNLATVDSMPVQPQSRWELGRQLSLFLRRLRWGVRLVLIGGLIFVAAQVASVYRLFQDVHPWLGVAAAFGFVALLVWFVGRPILQAVRIPRAIAPPELAPFEHRTRADCQAQFRYIRRYMTALSANPELANRADRIDDAISALNELGKHEGNVSQWGEALRAYEAQHLLPILAELDARVDALIHREALGVGTMTAISPNGTLDVFLVLWRNVNLVATIARMYYGRPGLRGTLLILKDVMSAILLASVMEQVSDISASMVRKMGEGSRAIPFVGAVVGPLLDGLVNSLMTMKLGYLAKERCRSFQAWDGRNTLPVVQRTMKLVSASASGMFDELVSRVEKPLSRVLATADAGRETVSDLSNRTIDFLKGIRDQLVGRRDQKKPGD